MTAQGPLAELGEAFLHPLDLVLGGSDCQVQGLLQVGRRQGGDHSEERLCQGWRRGQRTWQVREQGTTGSHHRATAMRNDEAKGQFQPPWAFLGLRVFPATPSRTLMTGSRFCGIRHLMVSHQLL